VKSRYGTFPITVVDSPSVAAGHMAAFCNTHLSDETFDGAACVTEPVCDGAACVSSNGDRADRTVSDRDRTDSPPTRCKSSEDKQAGRSSSDRNHSDA
jgi:hypothetical protein